jgi:opine dehydrogenase
VAERLGIQDERRPAFAVLGIGNGGQAMAGFLSLRGFAVNVWNRSPGKVEALNRLGGIQLNGEIQGFGAPSMVTNDVSRAIGGVHVVMVTVPATGHRDVAALLAPHLRDGQIVVLNPGRTGGALAFKRNLLEAGCSADITLAETNTFIYASRTLEPGRSHIYGIKQRVTLAALPAVRTMDVLRAVRPAFPQFVPAESVLATSLDNMGAIFHPAPMLLNVTRVEQGEKYHHYTHGISPAVARLLERLDSERMALAHALGVAARSAIQWLVETYGVTAQGLYQSIQANKAYQGIFAPESLDTRYIHEDIPFSLVPMAHLSEFAGLGSPVTRSIISLAEGLTGEDFWRTGRDAQEMGITGMARGELLRFVREGA